MKKLNIILFTLAVFVLSSCTFAPNLAEKNKDTSKLAKFSLNLSTEANARTMTNEAFPADSKITVTEITFTDEAAKTEVKSIAGNDNTWYLPEGTYTVAVKAEVSCLMDSKEIKANMAGYKKGIEIVKGDENTATISLYCVVAGGTGNINLKVYLPEEISSEYLFISEHTDQTGSRQQIYEFYANLVSLADSKNPIELTVENHREFSENEQKEKIYLSITGKTAIPAGTYILTIGYRKNEFNEDDSVVTRIFNFVLPDSVIEIVEGLTNTQQFTLPEFNPVLIDDIERNPYVSSTEFFIYTIEGTATFNKMKISTIKSQYWEDYPPYYLSNDFATCTFTEQGRGFLTYAIDSGKGRTLKIVQGIESNGIKQVDTIEIGNTSITLLQGTNVLSGYDDITAYNNVAYIRNRGDFYSFIVPEDLSQNSISVQVQSIGTIKSLENDQFIVDMVADDDGLIVCTEDWQENPGNFVFYKYTKASGFNVVNTLQTNLAKADQFSPSWVESDMLFVDSSLFVLYRSIDTDSLNYYSLGKMVVYQKQGNEYIFDYEKETPREENGYLTVDYYDYELQASLIGPVRFLSVSKQEGNPVTIYIADEGFVYLDNYQGSTGFRKMSRVMGCTLSGDFNDKLRMEGDFNEIPSGLERYFEYKVQDDDFGLVHIQ